MSPYKSDPDVVIVGAGAAGVGAGLALTRLGLTTTIIEAKPRIGGRAHTDTESLGAQWDRGCHWFHTADRNPLRTLADRLGHAYEKDWAPPVIGSFMDGEWAFRGSSRGVIWDNLARVSNEGAKGRDVSAASLLDRSGPMYPLVHHWFALMTSHDPEQISAADLGRYDDSHVNLPVSGGHGTLINKIAAGLPISVGVEARKIRVGSGRVEVETSHGPITAKAAVIAVPARIMQERRLVLEPGYPEWLSRALDAVPMGYYEKVALLFDKPVYPPEPTMYLDIFDPVAPTTEPLNFEISPFGRPLAIAHFAGDHARRMVEKGDAAMIEFTTETLARAFGNDVRKRIVKGAVTNWTRDPFTLGGYTCALPGKADERLAFQQPLHDLLFLAGEHTSPTRFATCHGAYLSGIDAAHKAAQKLGRPALAPDPLWLIEPEMA